MTNPTEGACDCGGCGVVLVDIDHGPRGSRHEIQRCDACALFESDDVAAHWIREFLHVAGAGEFADAHRVADHNGATKPMKET